MRVTYEVHIEKSSNNFGNSSIWLLQNEDCGKNANGIRPFPTIYNDLQDHSTISTFSLQFIGQLRNSWSLGLLLVC